MDITTLVIILLIVLAIILIGSLVRERAKNPFKK